MIRGNTIFRRDEDIQLHIFDDLVFPERSTRRKYNKAALIVGSWDCMAHLFFLI